MIIDFSFSSIHVFLSLHYHESLYQQILACYTNPSAKKPLVLGVDKELKGLAGTRFLNTKKSCIKEVWSEGGWASIHQRRYDFCRRTSLRTLGWQARWGVELRGTGQVQHPGREMKHRPPSPSSSLLCKLHKCYYLLLAVLDNRSRDQICCLAPFLHAGQLEKKTT